MVIKLSSNAIFIRVQLDSSNIGLKTLLGSLLTIFKYLYRRVASTKVRYKFKFFVKVVISMTHGYE